MKKRGLPVKRRFITISIIFLISGCSLAPSIVHSKKDSNELNLGIQYIQQSNFIKARSVFTDLVESDAGSWERSEARWYLALITEKLDSPDQAIQNYRDFLKSFPYSSHKKEGEERLEALEKRSASVPNEAGDQKKEGVDQKRGIQPVVAGSRNGSDRVSGAFITEFLFDEAVSPSPSMNTQSRLTEFLDFRWKKGSGTDLRFYFSGMNVNDFLLSRNNRERLNKFFLEGNNIGWFSNIRFGRQPSTGSTLFNRFDGLSFSLPFYPVTWTHNLGVPVDLFARDPLAIQSDRKFYETYLSVTDFYHLTGRIYFTEDYFQVFSTRKAVGLNGYWMLNNFNLAASFDHDIGFNKINDLMASLDYTQSRFHYSGLMEYRRNPFLDMKNALADPSVLALSPPVTSLDILQQTMTRDQIAQLALNNSQKTLDDHLGLSIDLTSIWRVDLRYGKTFFNPVDPLGHLFTPSNSVKTIDQYSLFILERNFFNVNDTISALFLYQPGTDLSNQSVIMNFIQSLSGGYKGGARFRYEQTRFSFSDNITTRVVPGLWMTSLSESGMELSFEADYVMEQNTLSADATDTVQTRMSFSIPF